MVYHLRIEARRPPSWLWPAERSHHLTRLRAALGAGLTRGATMRWAGDGTLALVLRYSSLEQEGRERHQLVLKTVMRAVDQAGLFATSAVVTRVVSHWAQGALAGGLTGLGLGRGSRPPLRPLVALGGIAVGLLAGTLVRSEVPVFRAALLPYTGWRLIQVEPESSGPRIRVGLG